MKKAPDFKIKSESKVVISLKELLKENKAVVLYFYPKDDTSGCTKEACAFNDSLSKFKKLGVAVVGVSPDSDKSHDKFKSKYGLKFDLIADVDKELCEKYGVWVEKSMYGRKYMGVQRSTFLIGKDREILQSWLKVKVDGHVKEVLDAIST